MIRAPRLAPARPAGVGRRVAVAMSGGVDSSAAAALLVDQGHDVVGVHMKLHDLPDEQRRDKSCCSVDDALDARQVCAELGIPFYVIDLTAEFQQSVIEYFVADYAAGRTPNPCVMCNQHLKNAALLERVRQFGCDSLATGHYARVAQNPATGDYEILRPRDQEKDQTYFLFGTPREELPHLLFPLADHVKAEARALAGKRHFITWNKPDSQEICFVTGNYRDFIAPRLPEQRPGNFVDTEGRVLGEHRGVAYYTVGQRRGLGVNSPRPLYVVAIEPETDRVVLGEEDRLYASHLRVREVNWVSCPPPAQRIEARVKIRYAHAGTPARITPTPGGGAEVAFTEPVRAIAPGQAAVFYRGDVMLGGGWIEGGAV